MNRTILLLTLLTMFFPLGAAHAQPARCEAVYEMIVKPYEPSFGVPSVWDAEYSEDDTMVQFLASVPREGGTVLTYGRTLSEENYRPEETLLLDLNRRGRALITKRQPAKTAELPTDIIALSSGYVTASDIAAGRKKELRQVRLSFFNENVDYKKNVIIKDNVFDYESKKLLPVSGGTGFILMLRAKKRDDPRDFNSVMMRFAADGRMLWERAFRPGLPNTLFEIIPIGDKNYLAAGQIETEDGRMAGWILKLGIDGTIYWQRTYPRGASSVLVGAAEVPQGDPNGQRFVLIGNSEPLDRGLSATWVLSINDGGDPVWQRYFRNDDYKMEGKALTMSDDGRVIVAMNTEAAGTALEASHIRLLTLSPRGALIQDESYLSGIEATAHDFDMGWNGERIVTATIRKVPAPPAEDNIIGSGLFNLQEPEEFEVKTDEAGNVIEEDPITKGWVFVGTALDPYVDPCRIQ